MGDRSLLQRGISGLRKRGIIPLEKPMEGSDARLLELADHFNEAECRPLMDPPFVAAGDAAHMREDDVVLGVEFDGDARAYPWWIMDNHHAANDVVGGKPVLVVLCEMCSTGIAFDRVLDGRRYTFEVNHFYNGTVAARDHQTGSIWSPYLAEAIEGPMKGRRLELLPLYQMEWRAWRELHPGTRVLPGELGSRTGHGSKHTIGSPVVPPETKRTLARWDERLPHSTLVMGAIAPDRSVTRAYPLSLLRERGGVVNDDLAGEPVVVLLHPGEGSYGAVAFSRVLDDRELTFRSEDGAFVDEQTGSRWGVDGRCVAGELDGRSLRFVDSHVSEWFIWAAHYPDIQIAT